MARVRDVDVVLGGEVQHARAPHVVEQRRLVVAAEQALEEDALAQARLGRLEAVEAARPAARPARRRRPARIRSARAGLMPGTLARSAAGSAASRSTSSSSAVALDHHPLHAVGRQPGGALRGGGEVAHRSADADEPRRRRRARRATARSASSLGDVLAQLLELPALGRAVRRQEALAHAHRAERHEPDSLCEALARRARAASSRRRGRARSRRSSVVELTAAR